MAQREAETRTFYEGRSELGVIVAGWSDDDYWKGERHVYWRVKVPFWAKRFPAEKITATWTCIWSCGASDFAVGDAVRLVHPWRDEYEKEEEKRTGEPYDDDALIILSMTHGGTMMSRRP